jgi:hypothetical protein
MGVEHMFPLRLTLMGIRSFCSGSTVPNQQAGAFWAVLNRLLIIGQVIVLILSEMCFPLRFFDRYFPVLGQNFGLGALGVIQMLSVALSFLVLVV